MAILRITLCAVFMVTVVLSKPVPLSEDEDSSESSEANSSEESTPHVGPSEEALHPAHTEEVVPPAVEETAPPATTALLPPADTTGPSPAALNTSALPVLEDPPTSTDIVGLQLMPDDTSQTALGIDISRDMPDSDPAGDSINADGEHVLLDTEISPHPGLTEADIIAGTDGTNRPQFTTTYQGFPQGATPRIPPHIIKSTSSPSAAPPLPINIGPTLTGVPVCFRLQFSTPEPDPPRGDSI